MRILLISNGSGEDRIATQLAIRWRELEPQTHFKALALVGSGLFYQQAGIELLAPRFSPPSQGFAYLHPGLLLKDFQAGLGQHLLTSLKLLKQLRQEFDRVLAVGDLVAVIAGLRLQKPLAFVGCALSDYYLGKLTTGSSYDPLQRLLLKRSGALVFARDDLTAANLKRRGLKAHFAGNPMLDCFEQPAEPSPYQVSQAGGRSLVLLLPGSHTDALANFELMLQQLSLCKHLPVDFVLVCAPQCDLQAFEACLSAWQRQQGFWAAEQNRLWLLESKWFKPLLEQASAVVGLAGTANEQAVGLGVPLISFAGTGQQYTWAFGEAQQRLLGPGLSFLGEPHPLLLKHQLERVLHDSRYRRLAQEAAWQRFGQPGADQRIVKTILGQTEIL